MEGIFVQFAKLLKIPFIGVAEDCIIHKKIGENEGEYLKEYITNLRFEFARYNLWSKNYIQSIKLLSECSSKYFLKNILWYSKRFVLVYLNIIKNRLFKTNKQLL